MSGKQLRAKRVQEGISGEVLCVAIQKSRSWLSLVERKENVVDEESAMVVRGIQRIAENRKRVAQLAREANCDLVGVAL